MFGAATDGICKVASIHYSGKQGWKKKKHRLTPWVHETELYYLAVLFQVWRSSCTSYKEIFELAMLVSSRHVGTPSWTGFLWEIWVLSKECHGDHRTPTYTGTVCFICYDIQSTLSETDNLGTCSMCPSYRESNKGGKERQGPTLGVRFTEVSVLGVR